MRSEYSYSHPKSRQLGTHHMKRHFQKAGLRRALRLNVGMLLVLACFLTVYVEYFAEDMRRLYELFYSANPAEAENILFFRLSILWAAALPLCLSYIFDRGYVLSFALLLLAAITGLAIDFHSRQSIDWGAVPSFERFSINFLLWKANVVLVARLMFIGFISHGLRTSYRALKAHDH